VEGLAKLLNAERRGQMDKDIISLKKMPEPGLKKTLQQGDDRLPGEFVLEAAGHELSKDEENYRTAISHVFRRPRLEALDDKKNDLEKTSPALAQARKKLRDNLIKELATDFEEYTNNLPAERAYERAYIARGKYDLNLELLARSLFVVEPKLEGHIIDISIDVANDKKISDDPANQAKQALYVALNSAKTVVKTVADRIDHRGNLRARFHRLEDQTLAQRVRDKYLNKLVEIGRLGLQNPHVELANAALNGFRAEFVAQEAGRIKNTYLRSLGIAAGIAAATFFFAYLVVTYTDVANGFFDMHRIFLLAAGSSAIGTWLSFSIRRVTLGFDDLAVLEEDRLDPSLRVIFVVILTTVVLLLFWTGAMNIEIGNLKTADLSNPQSTLPIGAIALLVGVFCGISERALTTAISGRAAAFVKSLGS
jgi:hypothetical protein